MDRLKKTRTPVRASVTKAVNILVAEVIKPVPDKELIEVQTVKLKRLGDELFVLDEEVREVMLAENFSEEDFGAEMTAIEEYREKLDLAWVKARKILKQTEDGSLVAESTSSQKRKFKLPKLELKKFGGEISEWLSFWGQFRKIDEDGDIAPEDKFQYLLQATTVGSRAHDVVSSFPPSAANYPKAVYSLKNRFGRDDLLVEVYVRNLLELVIQNVSSSRGKLELSLLYDKLESHLRALETLGVTSDKYEAMLFPLVESCLPEDILRVWQRNSSGNVNVEAGGKENNRLSQLLAFLRNEVEGEERITLARAGFGVSDHQGQGKQKKKLQESVPTATDLFSGDRREKKPLCVFCEKPHESKDCFAAQKMTFNEKKTAILRKKACFVCFKSGHQSKFCKANVKCVICGRKHFVIMCPDISSSKEKEEKPREEKEIAANMSSRYSSSEVVLQTLMVNIKGAGKERLARAIIDTGSQSSYILKKTAIEMGYVPVNTETVIHKLFGGVKTEKQAHNRYDVSLKNVNGDFSCKIKMLDQKIICGDIPRVKRGSWFHELKEKKIWLSDVGENCPEIEILIGSDVAGKLLTGRVHHMRTGLVAVETRLGWTVMGKVPGEKRGESTGLMAISLLTHEASVAELWKLDTIGIMDPSETKSKKEMEEAATEHFRKSVRVNDEGRYEVDLPWIEGHAEINDNKAMAEKRLVTATKKLVDTGKFQDYEAVFKEWLDLGVIEEVPKEELDMFGHYLPHRGVFKNQSTTKCRPVFDASARSKGYPSLNDCLEKGQNLIELIPSVLTKFREYNIGVISDITKAFLQISVKKKDCEFLRFLWWENYEEKRLKVFRHRRVVFGVTCSPFLLGSVINYHLEHATPELQLSAKKLAKSLYIDNCVTSVNTESELYEFIKDARELMSSAKFDLRGWEHTCLRGVSEEVVEKPTPVLGMFWDKQEDSLSFDMTKFEDFDGPVTRRNVLASANKLFDPLGIACPVMLCPKVILQQSWDLKTGWDDELPQKLNEDFGKWVEELPLLGELKVPRQVTFRSSDRGSWSLHTFCDASKSAYAAVVFLRSEYQDQVNVQFIQAKARVAPLRKTTIPRLELLGCTIGTRLATSVKENLEFPEIPVHYWSDSSTALSWIKRDDQWGAFVHNRVKEIRSLSGVDSWRHVRTKDNPADLPSRGCTVKVLLESKWWEGPAWLKRDARDWPKSIINPNEDEINQERKKGVISSLISIEGEKPWYTKYVSGYEKTVRLITWMLRFINNMRHKKAARLDGVRLGVDELQNGEKILLRIVQGERFVDEGDKTLNSLGVFKDSMGLIRVKTKISRRKDDEDFKSPILLPFNHELVSCLIREEHYRNSHAGIQVLTSKIRERFWILKARKSIRKVILECLRCRRYQAKKTEAISAPLPEDRVRDASVFEIVGVDLAGPLYLKDKKKAWIVLYTCAVYRAVHLELIVSLSTDAFLQGLRRFIARRGRPSIMYSDNGTNFVGAENLFKGLDWNKIENHATALRIQWRFNPPTAAWWGGFWERLVRMVKELLRRVLGKASLHYEELMTILCDCEAVINSRPLTYLSEDVNDLAPLTPSMFLQENREVGVPDLDSLDTVNITKRFQYQQRLRAELRQRFRSEYLGKLVQCDKKKNRGVLNVGDIVLIGSDNSKRLDWPMAKVIELYPGKDNVVRVVRVKTASGELLRPIQRIYPLELSAEKREVISTKVKVDKMDNEKVNDKLDNVKVNNCMDNVKVNDCVDNEKVNDCVDKVIYTRSGRKVKPPEKLSL